MHNVQCIMADFSMRPSALVEMTEMVENNNRERWSEA